MMNLKDDKAPILNIFNSVIKNHELSSQYFLDWILINFSCSDLVWEFGNETKFKTGNQIENKFSISELGKRKTIGTFKEKDNFINYNFNSHSYFENNFFIDFIKNTLKDDLQEDHVLNYEKSIFGTLRLRISRRSSILVARIIFIEYPISEQEYYYLTPLKIILSYLIENQNLISDIQKDTIKKEYYSLLGENIDFNDLEQSIFLLTEFEEFSKVIIY